ncbi:MAG: sugar phosphate isomerase/epimerase family protein [Armatimonadota bacterium]
MSNIPLGISTWSLNGLAPVEVGAMADGQPFNPEYADAAIAYFTEIADAVLDSETAAIELWYSETLYYEPVLEQLKRLSSAGKIRSVHAPFAPHLDLSSPDAGIRESGISACCKSARLVSQLNGSVLLIHGSSVYTMPDDISGRMRLSAESIRSIADYCADFGINVAVEILVRPNLGETDTEILEMLKIADRPNIGFCIDVNHVFPSDRLIQTVYTLGEKIISLHISDYDGVTERHWLPGKGIINWQELVRALVSVSYPGPFLYEVRLGGMSVKDGICTIEENYRQITAMI